LTFRWRRQIHPQLEPSPDRAVEEFRVIGGANHNDMRWEIVDLEQQGTYYSFDFAGLMNVPAFLAQRVEFIEE